MGCSEGSVPGPPAHSGPYILTPSLGLDVVRSPSQLNPSLLGMPREEDSQGASLPPQSRLELGGDKIESFLVQEHQEDGAGRQESPGTDTKGRHTNSSGSKSRILAFVTEAAGRGQSLHCVATLHCTVLYCTVLYCTVLYFIVLYCNVLYCTVLYSVSAVGLTQYTVQLCRQGHVAVVRTK